MLLLAVSLFSPFAHLTSLFTFMGGQNKDRDAMHTPHPHPLARPHPSPFIPLLFSSLLSLLAVTPIYFVPLPTAYSMYKHLCVLVCFPLSSNPLFCHFIKMLPRIPSDPPIGRNALPDKHFPRKHFLLLQTGTNAVATRGGGMARHGPVR